jgi:hypothetical protein
VGLLAGAECAHNRSGVVLFHLTAAVSASLAPSAVAFPSSSKPASTQSAALAAAAAASSSFAAAASIATFAATCPLTATTRTLSSSQSVRDYWNMVSACTPCDVVSVPGDPR